MFRYLYSWLVWGGLEDRTAVWLARYGGIFLIILVSVAVYFIVQRFLLRLVARLTAHTHTLWDDALVNQRVHRYVAALVPALLLLALAPAALEGPTYEGWIPTVNVLIYLYLIVLFVFIANGTLRATLQVSRQSESGRHLPITSLVQILRIGVYFVAGLLLISLLIGRTPLYILSGLGAVTAVLSFIYQDALRGFVAGIQLTGNKLLARGDWIEMPSYDVNGIVSEVGLTTVKVENFDYSITTVPTYALISESFKNWRWMLESGGRRIQREIYIDVDSIKRCTPDMLARYGTSAYVRAYIDRQAAEAEDHTLTNIGILRAYIEAYLQNHPEINQAMTILVQQLPMTANGLPLLVTAFVTNTDGVYYAKVQSDIFDHLLTAVTEFDLRLFQNPSGRDVRASA